VPEDITIDGSLSSQFLTGLLLAYSAALRNEKLPRKEPVTIHVTDLKSRPYIDLTLEMLSHFGMPVPEQVNYEQFIFHPGEKQFGPQEVIYSVEGDWSGASFLLVAGAIAGPVTVRGLNLLSAQADKAIMDILMAANAGVAVEAKGIIVHPGELHSFRFDATDCPDLFPPAAVLASYCRGESVIKGVSRLKYKESNRGVTLQRELGKMGINIDLLDDEMIIQGNGIVHGADVNSCGDHRIAMACAVAGLGAKGETRIHDAEVVNKSYREFYEDLKSLGASVSLDNKFTWHE
jgi:3-phosphoshikimate 1-carboxyvinyltransferase